MVITIVIAYVVRIAFLYARDVIDHKRTGKTEYPAECFVIITSKPEGSKTAHRQAADKRILALIRQREHLTGKRHQLSACHLAPPGVETVILFCKIFDGFSDLVAGQYIDTHKSKYGHCIPVLLRWSLPMLASVVLTFLVPDTTPALQLAFIFVTYNLFNTIFYTIVCAAAASLPSYAADDPTDRSQMLAYSMLFAAGMQVVVASKIMPIVEYFGGMNSQAAWVKATLFFGAIGLVFLFLNAFFVKERVENDKPAENVLKGAGFAFRNKYWIYTLVIGICANILLIFNLSVSVYYLKDVMGNLGLMGSFIAVSNVPGVFLMMVVPSVLGKISKRALVVFGTVLILAGQILFILGPSDNVTWFLATGLIKGIGMGFPMGLAGAMIGDCVDYGEWKLGTRVQSVLFAANTVGQKIGQGLLTSLLGIFLAAVGYDGLKEVQSEATIAGIDGFFKYGPVVVCIFLGVAAYLFTIEKDLPTMLKEVAERKTHA